MKRIQIKNPDEGYGVFYSSIDRTITNDYISNSLKLPLGEILFNIIESIDLLSGIVFNDQQNELEHIIKNHFSEKAYDLSPLFLKFKINIEELKRLERIRDYLEICSSNYSVCTNLSLKDFSTSIFDEDNEILMLFSPVNSLRIRKFKADFKLPYFYDIQYLITELSNSYINYEFYTITEYKSLSELCIISLFEIFSLSYLIRKCNNCARYYLAQSTSSKYCDRKSMDNDFQGCKKFKVHLTNLDYSNNTLVSLFKRVYNKLFNRAKNNKIEDVNLFENFKTGWKSLNKEYKHSPERQAILEDYLNSERWK